MNIDLREKVYDSFEEQTVMLDNSKLSLDSRARIRKLSDVQDYNKSPKSVVFSKGIQQKNRIQIAQQVIQSSAEDSLPEASEKSSELTEQVAHVVMNYPMDCERKDSETNSPLSKRQATTKLSTVKSLYQRESKNSQHSQDSTTFKKQFNDIQVTMDKIAKIENPPPSFQSAKP